MSEKNVEELIKMFEAGTLPEERWTHKCHFIMALWYLNKFPFPQAVFKIKEGIKQFNIAKGDKNTANSGYHETITQCYIFIILNFLNSFPVASSFQDFLIKLDTQLFLEKDYLLNFYTRKVLFSHQARLQWISPDIRPLPLFFKTSTIL